MKRGLSAPSGHRPVSFIECLATLSANGFGTVKDVTAEGGARFTRVLDSVEPPRKTPAKRSMNCFAQRALWLAPSALWLWGRAA